MKIPFADTSYYLALLNARDQYHQQAKQASSRLQGQIVTTTWVLTEVADAFSKPGQRQTAAAFIEDLLTDSRVMVIAPSMDLFNRGLSFYSRRPDKDWSLTDCISFVVMEEHGLTEALATDRDFKQAGFVALLP
jgi:predicted nucleic acid-binding protein